jgi:hypothetical protein
MSTKFSPRPILKSARSSTLKRPSPLNQDDLDPLLSATLQVQFSPAFLSPHVHFPPTPVLTSTITARSPKSGDRTAFIFSPSKEKFGDAQYLIFQPSAKLPADVPPSPPSDFSFASNSDSSASDSDDYATTVITSKHRFIPKVPNSPIPHARSQQEIDKALSFLPYPLSPFPRSPKLKSAPPTRPSFFKSVFRRDSDSKRSSPLAPQLSPSVGGGGVKSLQTTFTKPKRSPRPAALIVPATSPYNVPRFVPPGLWPHGTALSPVVESPPSTPAVTLECPSSDEASDATTSTLRSAFWRSVSVQQSGSEDNDDNEIARGSQDSLPTSVALVSPPVLSPEALLTPSVPSPDLLSPPPRSPYPIFMFGKKDKGLWSPRLPRLKTKAGSLSEQVMSPQAYSPATTALAAKTFESMTSPTPIDNTSSFPSIAAALEFLGAPGMITFPLTT